MIFFNNRAKAMFIVDQSERLTVHPPSKTKAHSAPSSKTKAHSAPPSKTKVHSAPPPFRDKGSQCTPPPPSWGKVAPVIWKAEDPISREK